jgi:hypothetical protein
LPWRTISRRGGARQTPKSAKLSDWNYDLLPIELAGLQEMNYDLGLLGFDQDELARLLDPGVKDGLCDPDEVPAPPDEATTQPGDLWLLGNHRLLCGDAGRAEDVDRLLGGAPIHLVNTDPPYNVRLEPRSNNAIAAGLSSFEVTHHQKMDVVRRPKARAVTYFPHNTRNDQSGGRAGHLPLRGWRRTCFYRIDRSQRAAHTWEQSSKRRCDRPV